MNCTILKATVAEGTDVNSLWQHILFALFTCWAYSQQLLLLRRIDDANEHDVLLFSVKIQNPNIYCTLHLIHHIPQVSLRQIVHVYLWSSVGVRPACWSIKTLQCTIGSMLSASLLTAVTHHQVWITCACLAIVVEMTVAIRTVLQFEFTQLLPP